MTRYAIALGSNLGDRHQTLASAVSALSAHSTQIAVSSLYETEPVGGPDQPPFLNAVFVGDFDLEPRQLLDLTQSIESDHGRVREERWGPRTLDLDLVTSEAGSYHDEALDIPHPRGSEREFVLRPLAEIWAEAPIGSSSAHELVQSIEPQGVDRLLQDWIPPLSPTIPRLLVAGQFLLFAVIGLLWLVDGNLPADDWTGLRIAGVVLAVVGLSMAIDSSRRIGSAMTASPVPAPYAALVDTGPFRLVRHPIYGGVVLLMIGTSLFLDSVVGAASAAVLIPYFWLKSQYEEKRLRLAFPGYRAYAAKVRRRLIPFLLLLR